MNTTEEKAKAYAEKHRTVAIGVDMAFDISRQVERAYLAGATEALAGQWRSVKDELPPVDKDVLVSMGCGEFGVVWLSALSNGTRKWYSNDDTLSLDDIKLWMPIPEPPKDEKK